MSLKNFLLLEDTLEAASTGAVFSIGGDEGHHGARVMRLRAGESILVTDACAHQAEASIVSVSKSSFDIELSETPRYEEAPATLLVLVQALAKGGRDESAIEMATELGVDRVIPWQADRSVVQWKGVKEEKGREKWRSRINAAVKQSRRARIPALETAVTSAELAPLIESAVSRGAMVLALHESATERLGRVTRELAMRAANAGEMPGEVWVLVGPEGGISDEEIRRFSAAGATPVLLGNEILRASSAGPAALAALCSVIGRWQ
ncbi:16S rRNA (uracil(1498)-N(3))-methyltransferase [Dermabacter vaginalis]|uniref:16S rRNA (uracil(1498)-N(3))-methyltransferase n=1 Tax=Dermabacter vaginalis TaxID=1630135 RepID=UPI0016877662|nr:16S rRNA (uracil(1498)-N(3))-methyltransferase [Dermabacter vaginalis]